MKKIISFLMGLALCMSLSSCMTAQAQVDDTYAAAYGYDEVNFTLVISNGIPYYNTDGLLLYYSYNGWYYYPYYYNNAYYFHRYRNPLLPYYYRRYYKPLPRNFHRHGSVIPNGRFDRRPPHHSNGSNFNRTPNMNNRQRPTHQFTPNNQRVPNNNGGNKITPNGGDNKPNVRQNTNRGTTITPRPTSPTRIHPSTRTSTRGGRR